MVEKPKGEGDSRRSDGEGEDYRGGHNFNEKKFKEKIDWVHFLLLLIQ